MRGLLYDIAEACRLVREFTSAASVELYERDRLLQSACERQLEIVGEAMTRIRDRHRAVFDRIPDGPSIIGLRNRLIHGYDAVDSLIVWDLITGKLPSLEAEVNTLLDAMK